MRWKRKGGGERESSKSVLRERERERERERVKRELNVLMKESIDLYEGICEMHVFLYLSSKTLPV